LPSPSSSTRTSFLPPSSMWIASRRAPASTAFSTSSLMTEAGRSTTSPAAIWLASSGERRLILPIRGAMQLRSKNQRIKNSRNRNEASPPVSNLRTRERILNSYFLILNSQALLSDPPPPAEGCDHSYHHGSQAADHPPELRAVAAGKTGQRYVHAPDAGDERRRHEQQGHEGQHFHHLVEAEADVREMRVEHAGNPILENQRVVGDPHEVIVDVAEAERHLG